MMRSMIVGAVLFSSLVFAAEPAKAAAPAAAPAKAAPAAAAPAAAVTEADCDMHKAQATMMKDVMASKAKMEMVKLNNGWTGIITADKKSEPMVTKAMGGMETAMKDVESGKAKLCDECKGHVEAMKAGKVMDGMGHDEKAMVWTHTVMSSDAEMVKKMHAMVDTKMAPPAKK